jgi:general secretion pathway protein B
MSYILDALTRSQKQRERSTVPTLTTEYLTAQSKYSAFNSWQGITIGLMSAAVLIALYTMSNRPFTPDALVREPAAAPAMPSVSLPGSPRPAAVTERATHLSRAEADAAGGALAHSRAHTDGVEHDPPEIRVRQAAHSPGTRAERRLSPESRRLADEILALSRETDHDAARVQAPSGALDDMQIPAAPSRGEDAARLPAHAANPPPVGAATDSASKLPAFRQLPLETQATLPALRINVHAYAQTSEERMVIINMKSYREGDRLREGPLIEAITPTGVVLIFDNQRFQLPAR